MTEVSPASAAHDIETPDSIQTRFGIDYLDVDFADKTILMSMPIAGLRNPFTGAAAAGPLAILLDAAGGLVNHYRRRADQWTVSSELALELSPDCIEGIERVGSPVLASARPLGGVGTSALSVCTLTCGSAVIGWGTVRSFYIAADGVLPERPTQTLVHSADISLADLMAVQLGSSGDESQRVLTQRADPNLNNDLGIVHGGAAAAGLELAASAAINRTRGDGLLRTASLRVNFMRPFVAGRHSRYVGTALRVGRSTAVGDALAIGDDAKVAITARVTAYL
ncbi:hotdog fold thioesterase [soil metagenome]